LVPFCSNQRSLVPHLITARLRSALGFFTMKRRAPLLCLKIVATVRGVLSIVGELFSPRSDCPLGSPLTPLPLALSCLYRLLRSFVFSHSSLPSRDRDRMAIYFVASFSEGVRTSPAHRISGDGGAFSALIISQGRRWFFFRRSPLQYLFPDAVF